MILVCYDMKFKIEYLKFRIEYMILVEYFREFKIACNSNATIELPCWYLIIMISY